MRTAMLAIGCITRDPALQVRHRIDQATVERYAEDWGLLPPMVVYRLPDGRLLLVDGWHRMAAAERIPLDEVPVVMREGDYTAACDEAARANMASGRQLTKEERHGAIIGSYWRHKPIAQQDLATLLGISQHAVSVALRIAEVREDVDESSFKTRDSDGARKPGRPKQPLKDDHLVELHAAPREERAPLAQATADRGWTPRETREAVREVKDPATPPARKDDLRQGKADPITRTPRGEAAALPGTFARAMAEPAGNAVYALYKDAAGKLAQLASIPDVGAAVVAGLSAADLAALATDPLRLPRYIGVLAEIREAAQRALRPSLQEVR